MKTTPDIKSYIKDTQQNILESDSSESGIWAFATDTGSIFVSHEGGWLEYASDRSKGTSTLSLNDETYNIPHGLIAHLDAKQTDSITSTANTAIENLAAVGSWSSTDQAILNLEADRTSQAPTYLSNGLGSGRPGIQFRRTSLTTPLEQSQHTYTGNFTVYIVMKFEPTWLNGDYHRKGFFADDEHIGGQNELIGSPPTHMGIYSSAVESDAVKDPLTIGSAIENKYAGNYWSYFRWRCGMGGHGTDTHTTNDATFAPQWNSDTNPDPGEAIKQGQVHESLRNLGMNLDDRMILCWQYKSADRLSPGLLTKSVAGSGRIINYDDLGDYVLRGLKIGGNANYEDGGWMTVGEFLVFDEMLSTNHLNVVGNYLSTKWSATWVDFE